jgi:hypothetical protein
MPMARRDKLIAAFEACTGPYPWSDFELMIKQAGYVPLKAGQSAGSRRRFHHPTSGHLIMCHEPHDGEMGPKFVREMQEKLRGRL